MSTTHVDWNSCVNQILNSKNIHGTYNMLLIFPDTTSYYRLWNLQSCDSDGVLCKVVLPRRRVVQSCVGATVCCVKLCQVSPTACCVLAWRCVVHSCVNATVRLFKRYVALTQMALSGHHTFQRVFANRNVSFHWKREKKICREDTGGGLRGGGSILDCFLTNPNL